MPFPVTPRYFINFRNSDTGLTPTFLFFKEAISPFSNVAPPTIVERSNGMYYFDWTWTTATDVDLHFTIDGGASIPTEEVRYVKGVISPRDRFVDEPISQVVADVWTDTVNRAVGTKGDFVEHIGTDADAVDAATVFGKVYKARDAIMGGTGFGGTGVDVKTTYDRIGAPQGGFTDIAAQIGDPSGSNSIAQDLAAIRGADNRDLTEIAGTGFVTGTDSLKVISDNIDQINVETDPSAIANAVWNELISSHQTAGSMGRFLNDIFRVLKNKAIINATTKQLEVYDDAGVSIIFTFDLKDEFGVASATRIFRRLPL